MLSDWSPRGAGEFDEQIYRMCVPAEHPLRRASNSIRWNDFYDVLAAKYSPNRGRPAEDPILMLKLEFLRYQYVLSDRQVIERTQTDMAFRCFLEIAIREPLPDPSSLCYFRGRLGAEGFREVFRRLVGQAREQGLIKDRLRIKDATHVIADVAIPTTLALVAQTRDRLLAAAEPFAALRVAGERANLELLRESCAGRSDQERLVTRVTHLREILLWADELTPLEQAHPDWPQFIAARRLAHKILADQERPAAGDLTRSVVDPDVRRSKHGDWYDGYLLDVLVDADSELITEINVLPANGHEAADAAKLVRQEEQAHGNCIEAISIDGAGYKGPVLRELTDPDGLALDVYVPPREPPDQGTIPADEFVEDQEAGHITCPAGQTSHYRQRDSERMGWIYRFKRAVCTACPLVVRCLGEIPKGSFGRTVRRSDYEPEYQRARSRAATPEYAAVRKEHPKVERKLGEIVNRHGGRRAHYRGLSKVLCQELMACVVTNVKRIVRLNCARMATAGIPN
jgi:transposase